MLEAYEAYGDYNTIGELTRELVQGSAVAALGSTVIRRADGSEYDIGGDWPKVTVYDAISAVAGEEVTAGTAEAELRKLCGRLEVPVAPGWNRGQIVLEMYERLVEKRTVQPTFYRDFPVEVSPLVRQHRSDPRAAERWDLVVFGAELGTGYSELVDPVVQRARLTAQSLLKAGGDPEAMELDEDFLRALEYGMPPTGGMGMGIDRLLMTLTGENIRETILFPFVRPERGARLDGTCLTSFLPGSLALVRDFGPGYRNHRDKMTKAGEIVGVRRVRGQFSRDCRCGDHEAGCPGAGLPAYCDYCCRHAPVGTSRIRVQGNRVELVLSALQDVQPAGPLGSLEVGVLLSIGSHLVRSGGKLGQRDGADRHLAGKLLRSDPAPQDHDVGI